MRRIFTLIAVGAALLISLFQLTTYAAVTLPPQYYPDGLPTISGDRPTGKAITETNVDEARTRFFFRIIQAILAIAGTVALFFIIDNAWWMVASAGNEEKITEHKKGLMWAIVGLILIILSFSIIQFIISLPFQADERSPGETTEQGSSQGGSTGGTKPDRQPIDPYDTRQPLDPYPEKPPETSPGDFPEPSRSESPA